MSDTDELDHDVIVVGAGVAGSRLVAHLLAGPWRTRRIAVIEAARRPDHVLAFWAGEATSLDPLVERSWTALRVPSADGGGVVRPLLRHRYAMLTRGAIEEVARAAGEACLALRFVEGVVDAIEDGPEAAVVRVGERRYRGTWVFDSRPPPPGPATIRLVQRFVGWTVESPAIFLSVLARAPARAPAIFAALMRRPDRTLRLLDERAGAVDLLLLIAALPTGLFLWATLRWLFTRRRPVAARPAAPP